MRRLGGIVTLLAALLLSACSVSVEGEAIYNGAGPAATTSPTEQAETDDVDAALCANMIGQPTEEVVDLSTSAGESLNLLCGFGSVSSSDLDGVVLNCEPINNTGALVYGFYSRVSADQNVYAAKVGGALSKLPDKVATDTVTLDDGTIGDAPAITADYLLAAGCVTDTASSATAGACGTACVAPRETLKDLGECIAKTFACNSELGEVSGSMADLIGQSWATTVLDQESDANVWMIQTAGDLGDCLTGQSTLEPCSGEVLMYVLALDKALDVLGG